MHRKQPPGLASSHLIIGSLTADLRSLQPHLTTGPPHQPHAGQARVRIDVQVPDRHRPHLDLIGLPGAEEQSRVQGQGLGEVYVQTAPDGESAPL